MHRRLSGINTSGVWIEPANIGERVEFSKLFGNEHPVEIDIGCGKGLFLAREGVRRPETNFLGVEVARKFAVPAAERAARLGLRNVRLLVADIRTFLCLLDDHSIQAAHVYFPDPWWKRRHKKRRIINPDFLGQLARVLTKDGELWFATDVEEYFGATLKLLEQSPAFSRLDDPVMNVPEHELDFLTHFERKYRKEGRSIYRARFRTISAPDSAASSTGS